MFTISDTVMVGGTPIVGVQVSANNGGGTATTNSKGRFSVKVPYNWSGEIALSKPGFMFPPKSYTIPVTEDYKDDMPASQIPRVRRTTPTTTPGLTEPRAVVPEGPEFVGVAPPTTLPPVPVVEKPLTPIEQLQKMLDELLDKQRQVTRVVEPNELVPEVPLISNIWEEEDIILVLQSIASQADVTIIPDETIMANVTCTLRDVPLETALDIVLGGTGYIWKKTPYYYLVCSAGIRDTMFSFVSETRRMKMNYITANAAVGLLSSVFRDYVQAEIGRPGTDTYTVVVTAPPALMERIISDLKQIDHARPAVLLDARIVVMEHGNLLNLGTEWGFPRISFGLFASDFQGTPGMIDFAGKMPWGLQIGYTPDAQFTNSLNIALNLLTQNDEATILANPQVLAQDGKVAEITVMTEEYYMMTAEATGGYYARSELEKVESGTKLTITPHIGDNNDITLELAIEVSDSIPRGIGSDLPVVTRRTSRNTVRIKDGGTVALAGLSENRTRTAKRRVPGLSKLPLIGGLFKNTNDEKSTREIAVFVTANIIPESGQSDQSIEFIEPSTPTIQAPQAPIRPMARPMERDFRTRLRNSLLRSPR
jgi:type II secretory pathway component GspD/PulD (secretin)